MPTPPESGARDWIEITPAALAVEQALAWVVVPSAGAVVLFSGIVRDHSDGRSGVTSLTYEAFEKEALRVLGEVVDVARERWPQVERIAVLHRVGDVGLSDSSVVVAASAPHRAEAFDVGRFCIDTLKETAPIWKLEHWEGGSDWGTCDHEIRPVGDRTTGTPMPLASGDRPTAPSAPTEG